MKYGLNGVFHELKLLLCEDCANLEEGDPCGCCDIYENIEARLKQTEADIDAILGGVSK